MYNDENREFDPVGGDLPPQPQQDRTDLPEEEPDEIVSWYTPRQEEPEEVVNYFVQQRPMPRNVWKQAAKTQRKRRRLWTWLGIGGIALVVVVIVVAVLLSSTASSAPNLPGSDDGDSCQQHGGYLPQEGDYHPPHLRGGGREAQLSGPLRSGAYHSAGVR